MATRPQAQQVASCFPEFDQPKWSPQERADGGVEPPGTGPESPGPSTRQGWSSVWPTPRRRPHSWRSCYPQGQAARTSGRWCGCCAERTS